MRRVRRVLGADDGYSVVEMLTVLAIMSVVLGGVTTLFVQGSNSGLDMNRRFEAQQTARVTLDKMRREVHCAANASTTPSTGEAPVVVLEMPSHCKTSGGSPQVTWCTVSVGTQRWALYRNIGTTCDASGVKWADHLVAANIFQYQTGDPSTLARLRVRFPVDVKPGDATPAYTLCDKLALRNSVRTGTAGTPLPDC